MEVEESQSYQKTGAYIEEAKKCEIINAKIEKILKSEMVTLKEVFEMIELSPNFT